MLLTDLYRGVVFLVCLASFVILMFRFVRHRKKWNAKTRDYWYALSMWSFAGMVIAFEGIRQHTPFGVRILVVSVAALVSLFGLRRRGSWGAGD
jgi:uncharacterized membrane protein